MKPSFFPKHFSPSIVRPPRARDSGIEAAGIKFTATRTDLRNAYLSARKLARRLGGGRSFYDWIRVGAAAVPELVEQVDKFRSLGEPSRSLPPSFALLRLFVVDKRIPEYRVGGVEECSSMAAASSRVAAKFG